MNIPLLTYLRRKPFMNLSKKLQIVYWEDSFTNHGWDNYQDISSHDQDIAVSVGLYKGKNHKYYFMVADIDTEDESNRFIAIPIKQIKKIINVCDVDIIHPDYEK